MSLVLFLSDINIYDIIEGSLEVKLPTIWTDRWKAEVEQKNGEEKSRREKGRKREDQRRERVGRKKIQVARKKAGKSRNTVFFPMICGSRGSKSRLAKAAGAETAGQIRDEKLHAVVARSTFPSQNVTKHFSYGAILEVALSKSARRCGAKHRSKSKCTRHTRSGPLLAVTMWKKAHAVVARSAFRSQNVKSI